MNLTNAYLDSKRQKADAIADDVLKLLQTNKHLQTIIRQNLNQLPTQTPDLLHYYWQTTQTLPAWADVSLLQKASNFFKKNTKTAMMMLGLYSLPYCYLAAKGVKVLYYSERMRSDTFTRLRETADFVLTVSDYTNWKNGNAFAVIRQVRLMHAYARYHLQKTATWQTVWGIPVNQEDMAGTNLAFSLIVLRGMAKTGTTYSTAEAEAFLHLWNVIGYLLGIDEDLLMHSLRSASQLDRRISERQFTPSPEGKELTAKLIHVLRTNFAGQMPIPTFMLESYMSYLLGEKNAEMLGLSVIPKRI